MGITDDQCLESYRLLTIALVQQLGGYAEINDAEMQKAHSRQLSVRHDGRNMKLRITERQPK